jgi:hypothetical protein
VTCYFAFNFEKYFQCVRDLSCPDCFVFQYFKNLSIFLWLTWFWWEVCCHSYLCFSVCTVLVMLLYMTFLTVLLLVAEFLGFVSVKELLRLEEFGSFIFYCTTSPFESLIAHLLACFILSHVSLWLVVSLSSFHFSSKSSIAVSSSSPTLL